MLADLGGFVVDFRHLPLPTSAGQDIKTVSVLDSSDDGRQIQPRKDTAYPAVAVSEGGFIRKVYNPLC